MRRREAAIKRRRSPKAIKRPPGGGSPLPALSPPKAPPCSPGALPPPAGSPSAPRSPHRSPASCSRPESRSTTASAGGLLSYEAVRALLPQAARTHPRAKKYKPPPMVLPGRDLSPYGETLSLRTKKGHKSNNPPASPTYLDLLRAQEERRRATRARMLELESKRRSEAGRRAARSQLLVLMRRVVTMWQHNFAGAALRGWMHMVARARRMRTLQRRIIHKWTLRTQISVMRRWVLYVSELHRLRAAGVAVVGRWSALRLRSTFAGWHHAAATNRRLRRVCGHLLAWWQRGCLVLAYQHWSAVAAAEGAVASHAVKVARAVELGGERARLRRLRTLLAGWKQFTAYRHHLASVSASIVFNWRLAAVGAAFRAWVSMVARRRARRDKVAQHLSKWRHHSLHAALSAWKSGLASRTTRDALTRMVARWAKVAMWPSFRRWKAVLEADAARLAVSLGRLMRRAKARAFLGWRSSTQAARSANLPSLARHLGVALGSISAFKPDNPSTALDAMFPGLPPDVTPVVVSVVSLKGFSFEAGLGGCGATVVGVPPAQAPCVSPGDALLAVNHHPVAKPFAPKPPPNAPPTSGTSADLLPSAPPPSAPPPAFGHGASLPFADVQAMLAKAEKGASPASPVVLAFAPGSASDRHPLHAAPVVPGSVPSVWVAAAVTVPAGRRAERTSVSLGWTNPGMEFEASKKTGVTVASVVPGMVGGLLAATGDAVVSINGKDADAKGFKAAFEAAQEGLAKGAPQDFVFERKTPSPLPARKRRLLLSFRSPPFGLTFGVHDGGAHVATVDSALWGDACPLVVGDKLISVDASPCKPSVEALQASLEAPTATGFKVLEFLVVAGSAEAPTESQ